MENFGSIAASTWSSEPIGLTSDEMISSASDSFYAPFPLVIKQAQVCTLTVWSNEIHDIYYSQNSLLSGSDDRSPTLQKIAQIYYLQKTSPWAINTTQSKHNVILPTLYKNFVKSLVVYFSLMFRII